MPPSFTERFAERLNGMSAMSVMEAKDGRTVMPGHVYVAPGDRHLMLTRSGAQFKCKLSDDGLVNGHKPSVDVLFDSVVAAAGQNALGVILTGMGKDGAEGMRKMRGSGAKTVCQDEASCLIYGMPKAAVAAGGVEHELPLGKIAGFIAENA
jgi:two-component system chemotaxis response regulator CheB